MINIVVYYGNPDEIRVSIDGMPSVDTREALNQIVTKIVPGQPDPFGPRFISVRFPLGSRSSGSVPPRFDWPTIREEDLQEMIHNNLLSYGPRLRDPDIHIHCTRGRPP